MKIIVNIILLSSIILAVNSHCTKAQNINVVFSDQLAIGEDENAEKEYLFGGPKLIVTDRLGRIYVGTINNEIRVYNKEGKFIQEFGGRGRGPSELLDISEMAIGHRGELIVRDNRNYKLVYYHHLGDSVVTYPYKDNQSTFKNISTLGNDKLVTLDIDQIPPSIDNSTTNEHRIIRITSDNLENEYYRTFNVFEHIFNKNLPLEFRLATTRDYRLTKIDENSFAITSEIYNGKVYFVTITQNGNTWQSKISESEGAFSDQQFYELLSRERDAAVVMKLAKSRYGVATSNGPGGLYIFQKKIQSIGLFSNENYILNFVTVANGAESSTFLELFDKTGAYLGHTDIDDDFTINTGLERKFYPMHLDNYNRLYYTDYSSEVPVIRIAKISINDPK